MPRIFRNEAALTPEYIPGKLPHREEQLKQLETYFSGFLEEPGSMYPKVVLIGRPGSGKTVTSRKFGNYVIKSSNRVRYVHVSCFLNRTLSSVLKDVGVQLNIAIPKRGFSTEELLKMLLDMIKEKDAYAIVALDDVFHLVNNSGPHALGTLIRLGEEYVSRGDRYRFGLILISQDLTFRDQLDRSSQSALGNAVIKFEPYTKDQIFEILLTRAQEALLDGAYDEEILEMIADVAGIDENSMDDHRGDARYAIDILWRASKLAEMKGSERILPEHVREAIKNTLRGIRSDELRMLPLHEKIFLLAIVKSLTKNPNSPYIPFGLAEDEYQVLCEQYGEEPRKHTQLWEYLKDLNTKGFVETRTSSKGMRGRTTLISIPSEPLVTLEEELRKIIEGELGT
ncbi:MAG: ORC1-type DNA replication protein [Vulcanisaeta sp.]|jgi:cell division control protein 6|uniref:ORC1-type DNA replication protein n=1 Tax=Vulcanisaeta moutnovskia (strain 768-28) TaxID=985053 RepID=F0QWY2_VULM7|nr:ORC1-type DNA replication protein [Vulcanisaeta moutnovskia]ADY01100.1 orc1/cdc6 family replication initiation protein [Vulcanisaeta moutnovskia 768-28]